MEDTYNDHDSQKDGNLLYRAAAATVRTIGRPFNRALDEIIAGFVGGIIIGAILDTVNEE